MNGQFENRYQRNMNTFTPEENRRMKDFKICVIGCGGLGGHIIEMLARLGVGQITAVDGDVFDETNLNRQLLSKESLIGKEKALAAEDRIREVNSEVRVNPVVAYWLSAVVGAAVIAAAVYGLARLGNAWAARRAG